MKRRYFVTRAGRRALVLLASTQAVALVLCATVALAACTSFYGATGAAPAVQRGVTTPGAAITDSGDCPSDALLAVAPNYRTVAAFRAIARVCASAAAE